MQLQNDDTNETLAAWFERCFPSSQVRKLVVQLMERGFDWRSFAGMTIYSLAEIDQMEMKPGDIYCGVRLHGAKKYTRK